MYAIIWKLEMKKIVHEKIWQLQRFFLYFKLQANDLSGKTTFTTITFVFGKYTNEESNEGV